MIWAPVPSAGSSSPNSTNRCTIAGCNPRRLAASSNGIRLRRVRTTAISYFVAFIFYLPGTDEDQNEIPRPTSEIVRVLLATVTEGSQFGYERIGRHVRRPDVPCLGL